jgi:hypothetical protein
MGQQKKKIKNRGKRRKKEEEVIEIFLSKAKGPGYWYNEEESLYSWKTVLKNNTGKKVLNLLKNFVTLYKKK